jgi:hypothetical protein
MRDHGIRDCYVAIFAFLGISFLWMMAVSLLVNHSFVNYDLEVRSESFFGGFFLTLFIISLLLPDRHFSRDFSGWKFASVFFTGMISAISNSKSNVGSTIAVFLFCWFIFYTIYCNEAPKMRLLKQRLYAAERLLIAMKRHTETTSAEWAHRLFYSLSAGGENPADWEEHLEIEQSRHRKGYCEEIEGSCCPWGGLDAEDRQRIGVHFLTAPTLSLERQEEISRFRREWDALRAKLGNSQEQRRTEQSVFHEQLPPTGTQLL